MPRGNPSPVITREFLEQQFKRCDDSVEPLGRSIPVRFPRSIDEELRSREGYTGLIREAVAKHLSDQANPQPVENNSSSTDEPMTAKEILECYGDRAKNPKSVFLPQVLVDALQDDDRLEEMGYSSAHHFMASAIVGEAKRRGMV